MQPTQNAILCLSFLILGIALQFCFGLSMFTSLAGTFFVMFGPMIVAHPHSGNDDPVFPHAQWKTIAPEKALEILDNLHHHNFHIPNRPFDDNILAVFGSIPLRFLCGIAAVVFYIRLDPILASICADIAFVPYDMFLVKYGASPSRIPSHVQADGAIDREKIDAIKNILEACAPRESLRAAVKFQISVGEDCHRIDDIQVPIYPQHRIPPILASDLCIVLNYYQGTAYPYVHYILALRGLATSKDVFKDVTGDTNFSIERKEVNGNAVFIVCETKGADRNNTNEKDILILLDIVEKMWKRLGEGGSEDARRLCPQESLRESSSIVPV